jgi:hypothetical protein
MPESFFVKRHAGAFSLMEICRTIELLVGTERGMEGMSKRKRPPDVTQFEVLYSSARRCCVCFALDRDYTEKKGQIAHIDRDPANNAMGNLAWLCLEHHDAYDTETSQSNGFSESEVRRYRQLLYDEVAKRRDPDPGDEAAAEKILKNKLIRDTKSFKSKASYAIVFT